MIEKDEVSSSITATSHQQNALAKRMVPTDTSNRGTSMGDNSVRLTRPSGAGGRSSWSVTDAERDREHPRNILIAVPDLARDSGLLHYIDALGVSVVAQASRAVSRGTLDSSVPQVAKSSRFCSQIFYRFALMDQTERFQTGPSGALGCERKELQVRHPERPGLLFNSPLKQTQCSLDAGGARS